jgi:hypothetical protein
MKANELLDKALDFIVETQEQNDYICEQMYEEYVGDYCEKNCQNLNKEQRELLFKKMREAGYEWDAEKKELKRIEQNPAWSEDDEEVHRKCICAMRASACGFPEEEKFVEKVDNWLKSLKDRYIWKPSDEQMKALSNAGNSFRPFEEGHKVLWSLYNDLKKLREE